MLLLHKNGLFDSSIGIFNDAQILFDEIKRQAHRMQTKLPLVMLENLTQTVWTRRRYQQSYNVAKCLYNLFVFFFFWDGFKQIRRSWQSQSDYCTNFKLSMLSIHFSLLLLFFLSIQSFLLFYSENIAKFEQFSLV